MAMDRVGGPMDRVGAPHPRPSRRRPGANLPALTGCPEAVGRGPSAELNRADLPGTKVEVERAAGGGQGWARAAEEVAGAGTAERAADGGGARAGVLADHPQLQPASAAAQRRQDRAAVGGDPQPGGRIQRPLRPSAATRSCRYRSACAATPASAQVPWKGSTAMVAETGPMPCAPGISTSGPAGSTL